MNSMTGFGRAEFADDKYHINIEIKTVNSKKSDIIFKMPSTLNVIENKLRQTLKKSLSRGRIEVYIDFIDLSENYKELVLNTDLAKKYLNLITKLREIDASINTEIDIDTLLSLPDIVTVREANYEQEQLEKVILPVFSKAIQEVIKSRAVEGENLRKDILLHAQNTAQIIEKIEKLAPEAIERSKVLIKERIREALGDVQLDEARFLNEVAILSDKLAIDEEIARLKSHIKLLIDTSNNTLSPLGKKLDFTLQELNREANTIASKSDNIDIVSLSVDLKTEIEKMREQVQNVE